MTNNMMSTADKRACQFSSWYRHFKNCTFKSKTINLPDDVVGYLLADGLILPKGCDDNLDRAGLEGDSDIEISDDETEHESDQAPDLSSFNNKLESTIEALGGKVFPKLNWSAPKDATWILMERNLKCTCPRDIYLLLKSSDFISHDLSQPFEGCPDQGDMDNTVQYQLTLRQWRDINPAGEFRCFVNNNKLIGICQRHQSARFPNIAKQRDEICTDIVTFFLDHVQSIFPLPHYVFDVYWTDDKVYVMDFNPYGCQTDSQLFTWAELSLEKPLQFDVHSDIEIKPVFRYVETERQVQATTYQRYAMPQDFLHLTTGHDPNKLIDLLRLRTQNDAESSSDDE